MALTADLIDQSVIDKEQELVTEELKNSGKPEDIAKKISLGKMNKFKEENSLLTQAWVMEPKKKVQDVVKELSIAIKGVSNATYTIPLKIRRFVKSRRRQTDTLFVTGLGRIAKG